MTGIIWAVWHYPVILLTGFNYPEHRMAGLALFTLFAVQISIILGWLQQRAGTSWAPGLAHSGINYFAEPVLAAVFPGASTVVLGVGGLLAIPAFAIVAVWVTATGRLGRRNDMTSQMGGRRDGSQRGVATIASPGDR
jgi:membrane protease YdiL (CAAX protease family)